MSFHRNVRGKVQSNLLNLTWLTEFILETLEPFILTLPVQCLGCYLVPLEAGAQITSLYFGDYGLFCRAGNDQQAQQSTYVAFLNPLLPCSCPSRY